MQQRSPRFLSTIKFNLLSVSELKRAQWWPLWSRGVHYINPEKQRGTTITPLCRQAAQWSYDELTVDSCPREGDQITRFASIQGTVIQKHCSLKSLKPADLQTPLEERIISAVKWNSWGGRNIHLESDWEAGLFTVLLAAPQTSTTLRGEQNVLLRPSWIWSCSFQNSHKPIPNFLETRPYSTNNTGIIRVLCPTPPPQLSGSWTDPMSELLGIPPGCPHHLSSPLHPAFALLGKTGSFLDALPSFSFLCF